MRYVIAIGGNALSSRRTLENLSSAIAALSRSGNEIIVTHGNGPQVGRLAFHGKKKLALLTEETEREMGKEIGRTIPGARAIMTHVIVDEKDKEFTNPTKPIGKFYTEKEAARLSKKGFVMKHLLKGYRRVVPSPRPGAVVEIKEIGAAARKSVVIAAGGGGIPVTRRGRRIVYEDAVVDKDLASSLLAIKLKADALFILTDVPGVFLGFKTKRQKLLRKVKAGALLKYAKKYHFEAGSMLPKAQACADFVRRTGKPAVIGSIERANSVFKMESGTMVVP